MAKEYPDRIDWLAARKFYVANTMVSYKDVAAEFAVSTTSVERHARKENWKLQRDKIEDKAVEKFEGEIVDKKSEVNDRHTIVYRNMQSLASAQLLLAYEEFKKAQAANPTNLSIHDDRIIKTYHMRDLFESLKLAIDGERVTLGLPITVTNTQITGADGKALFEQPDIDELYKLVEKTAQAIEENTKKDKED